MTLHDLKPLLFGQQIAPEIFEFTSTTLQCTIEPLSAFDSLQREFVPLLSGWVAAE